MDLRQYYENIRAVESRIPEEFAVVVSRETGDGGKEGTRSEVTRRLAAQMVVDGAARVATAKEKEEFYMDQAAAREAAAQAAAAQKVHITVLSTTEMDKLKGNKTKG